jgi:hypothetical protein
VSVLAGCPTERRLALSAVVSGAGTRGYENLGFSVPGTWLSRCRTSFGLVKIVLFEHRERDRTKGRRTGPAVSRRRGIARS